MRAPHPKLALLECRGARRARSCRAITEHRLSGKRYVCKTCGHRRRIPPDHPAEPYTLSRSHDTPVNDTIHNGSWRLRSGVHAPVGTFS